MIRLVFVLLVRIVEQHEIHHDDSIGNVVFDFVNEGVISDDNGMHLLTSVPVIVDCHGDFKVKVHMDVHLRNNHAPIFITPEAEHSNFCDLDDVQTEHVYIFEKESGDIRNGAVDEMKSTRVENHHV
eukprot:GHVH01006608.1.p1 GENE.GHVH01006608.1~~GHVH01006608.1.p1  ORF type:complete len:127 (-),score=21.72 GHVH01006608.1:460-840(-)